jgi:phospholipid/cholesterol/gamma-HCH transport system substrate-binding protein
MDSYKQEVTVGVMVIAGLVAFTIAMFWLTGRSLTAHGVPVQFVFRDIAGLKEGDPVRVSGVTKGRVSQIHLDRVGRVIVTLQLSTEVKPHSDASAVVASADFLGAKYVDYNPGSKPEMWPGDQPLGGSADEDVSALASKTAANANELIENLNKGLNASQLGTDLHNTLVVTQRGMRALTDVASGPLAQQTTQTLKALQQVMSRVDSMLGTSGAAANGRRLDTLTTNLSQLSANLTKATSSLNDLLTKMSRGEGSLGRMASDTMLYKNLNATLAALSGLLTDLKERPGRYLTVKVF